MSQINNYDKEQIQKPQTVFPFVVNTQQELSLLKLIPTNSEDNADITKIETVFMKHFLLQGLNQSNRIAIIKQMKLYSLTKDTVLYSEGGTGHIFYIIQSGKVQSFIDGNVIQTLTDWDCFGDLTLVHNCIREETIQAKTDTLLWCLPNTIIRDHLKTYNDNDYNTKEQLLNSIQMLSILDNAYKGLLTISMIEEVYQKDTIILTEGNDVNRLFFVKEGNVTVIKANEEVVSLEKGDCFGDKQILTQTKNTSLIKSSSYVVLYSISINSMKQIISHTFRDFILVNFIKHAFETSDIDIERNLIWKIYPCFKLKSYSKNDIVFKKGYAKNSALTMIIEGNLKNRQSNKYLPIQKGSILFSEIIFEEKVNGGNGTMINENTLTVDLVADPDCLLLSCDVNEIEQVALINFEHYVDKCRLISSFRNIPMFKHLSIELIEQLSEKVSFDSFKKNDIIIKEGEEGTKFFVIKSGKVDIYIKNRFFKTLNDYDYFGENNLFGNDKRTSTAIVKSESIVLYTVSKANFQKVINEENLINYLNQQIISQDTIVLIDDLDYIRTINDGIIDSLYLVQKRFDKQLFILQCIKKAIFNEYPYSLIENEKQILSQLDHPMMTKMIKTMKDDLRLFFLIEYNGEKRLSDVIRETIEGGVMTKQEALFYIGSLLYCVQYLQQKSIVHRDINPDNVIIGNNGYIKLFNFETAKIIKGKTMTVIGSPHYMSPEEIKGESYGFSTDLWSIGVCAFELLTGQLPFGGNTNEPLEIYKAIVSNDLFIPNTINDQECKSFLKSMLHKNIIKRLCSIEKIKGHPLFANFDWKGLINLKLKPPYIPINFSDKRSVLSQMTLVRYLSLSTLKSNTNESKCTKNKHNSNQRMKELDKWINSF